MAGGRTIAVAAWLCVVALPARAACGLQGSPLATEIPRLPLRQALDNLAAQTGLQYGWEVQREDVPRSSRVRAGTRVEAALQAMLRGTGLRFECVPGAPRLVKISALPELPPLPPEAAPDVPLPEVIVTGERNQPIPTDTRVWTSAQLREAGAKGIDGIARRTPGVEFDFLSSVGGGPYTNIAIRGVSDRHGNTAGLWLDDVPLPAVASNTFIRGFPYVFDAARAEVLRGPQPALLGASAQGGAVQFMSNQPSLEAFGGEAFTEAAFTSGGEPSWEAGLALGGPLLRQRVALRLSAWRRVEGGYVDRVDPFTRVVVDADANRVIFDSARAALRLDPADGVTLIPSVYYQSTRMRDSSQYMLWESPAFPGDSFSQPEHGRFRNGSLIAQPFGDDYILSSLKALLQLGSVSLHSVTGFVDRSAFMISDDTESRRWGGFGNPRGAAYPAGYEDLVKTHVRTTQHSFTQQIKLASDPARAWSWVAGAFLASTHTRETDHVAAPYSTPLAIRAGLGWERLDLTVPTAIVQRQLAGYGLVTFRPRPRLKLSAGLRVERHRSSAEVTLPAGMPPLPAAMPPLDSDQRSGNTVAAQQFGLEFDGGNVARNRVSEFHLRAGKGYAPGNIEAARPTCLEPTTVYPADTLWSHEVGTRQEWLAGRLRLDVNLFDIRWDNGREARRTCLFMHIPGKARSRGMDLAVRTRLGSGLDLALEASWVDATYRETLYNDGATRIIDVDGLVPVDGSLIVGRGDAINTPPQVASPWNVTAALTRRFTLGEAGMLTLRVEDIFHSRNKGPFYTAHPDLHAPYRAPALTGNPATHLVSVRAGLKRGAFDLALFVDNLLDSRPVLLKRNKGNDQVSLFYASTERPRAVGVSARWTLNATP